MRTPHHRNLALLGASFLLAVGLTACGDDDSEASDTPQTSTTAAAETTTTEAETETEETETEGAAGETIEVTAVDYHFEGLPSTVPVGTRLSLVNEGKEPHELAVIRIPDSETRSVEELIALPQEELASVFGGQPEPTMVVLAAPGQTDVPGAVVGDGTLTEPGRYAVTCFIPVGSDPSILEQAGPPAPSQAPPHASQGMWAELTVE